MNARGTIAIAHACVKATGCALPQSTPAPEPDRAQGRAAVAAADHSRLEISRLESRPSAVGAATNFTGTAVVDPLFAANGQRRGAAASVTFTPGSRTHWHTHPAGQTLVVTAGSGWVQEWGGERRAIHAGDVIWTPPRVKHWHGATTSHAMTHRAFQEPVDGQVVEWMEPVGDARDQR